MLPYNSHISMILLCSNLLLWCVECIFVTCLTKCLSWLVGVQSSHWSNVCNSNLVSISFIISEAYMEFWVFAWVLALKSGTKSKVVGSELDENFHSRWHALLWEQLEGLICMHGLSWEWLRVQISEMSSCLKGCSPGKVGWLLKVL